MIRSHFFSAGLESRQITIILWIHHNWLWFIDDCLLLLTQKPCVLSHLNLNPYSYSIVSASLCSGFPVFVLVMQVLLDRRAKGEQKTWETHGIQTLYCLCRSKPCSGKVHLMHNDSKRQSIWWALQANWTHFMQNEWVTEWMNTSNPRVLHLQFTPFEHHFLFYFPVMQRGDTAVSVWKKPLTNFSSLAKTWNSKKLIS